MEVRVCKDGMQILMTQIEYDLLLKCLAISVGYFNLSHDENDAIIQMIDDGLDYTSNQMLSSVIKI